jgi:hypothetical protein
MAKTSIADIDGEHMARRWFGLGNLRGRCWFIGMESGAREDPAWPEIWATRFGGAPVVGLQESAGDSERRWLGPYNVVHPTWTPLIRTRLAYDGLATGIGEVLDYQRELFCRADGDEALLDVSAYAPASRAGDAPRETYRDARIARLRGMLADHRPEIVVCFGMTDRATFEAICGGPFHADGFRWSDTTLCALVHHPKPRHRAPEPPQTWTELGAELRRRYEERVR